MRSLAITAGLAMLAITSAASAVPLSTVGAADTLVDWAALSPSNPTQETQFIADYLGVAASSIAYTQLPLSGGAAWQTVDGNPNLYAFDFGSTTPSLFLIKTGAGVGVDNVEGTYSHFLFQNVGALNWGVIDLDSFTRDRGQVEIAMVSHTGTSGTATNVPEPGTLGILAFSLAGLALARRRKIAEAA